MKRRLVAPVSVLCVALPFLASAQVPPAAPAKPDSPEVQALGLNPADVKMILMGHGHADHFGGSPYFQEHFGSKVYISAVDWDFMEHPPAGRNGQPPAPPQGLPKHDQVVVEGQPIVLGDF